MLSLRGDPELEAARGRRLGRRRPRRRRRGPATATTPPSGGGPTTTWRPRSTGGMRPPAPPAAPTRSPTPRAPSWSPSCTATAPPARPSCATAAAGSAAKAAAPRVRSGPPTSSPSPPPPTAAARSAATGPGSGSPGPAAAAATATSRTARPSSRGSRWPASPASSPGRCRGWSRPGRRIGPASTPPRPTLTGGHQGNEGRRVADGPLIACARLGEPERGAEPQGGAARRPRSRRRRVRWPPPGPRGRLGRG
jgi:hypothetical protein